MERRAIIIYTILTIITAAYIISPRVINTVSSIPRPVDCIEGIKASYNLYVIRNGIIVYSASEYDPLTIHWLKAVANYLLGLHGSGLSFIVESGSVVQDIDTEYGGLNPEPYIEFGSGSTSVSTSDYKLESLIARVSPDTVRVVDSGSQFIVEYNVSWTVTTAFQFSEIGLSIKIDIDPDSTTSFDYLLVAHNVIDPVSVEVDDIINVTYVVYVPYTEPFTRNFYAILINYFLGAYGSLDIVDVNGNNVVFDTGSNIDMVIGIGSASSGYDFSRYKLNAEAASDSASVNVNVTNDLISCRFSESFTFDETVSINENGLFINTDIDSSSNILYSKILIVYWVTEEFSVIANDVYYVSFTIDLLIW